MPKLSAKELAEQYGFALAFLHSDPSLKKLFNSAVAHSWSAEHFAAKLKNTSWYKHNGEAARQFDLLKTTDPASFRAKRSSTYASVRDAAEKLGTNISSKTLMRITENSLKFGWNDSQLRNVLSGYVKAHNGIYSGDTGDSLQEVLQTAYRNGINVSKSSQQKWAQQIAKGNNSAADYQRYVRGLAKSLAPGYAQELDGGMDLVDIANPFIESKAKILEMNPADIDLFDKDIRKALSGTTADGKPASTSLWQFEQQMRADPRWMKTQNAQDAMSSTAKKVLTDFGFQGVG